MTIHKSSLEQSDALELADAISAWLRDRITEAGAQRFVLGLSGGIDSAVVAGLCARAVDPDRVLGVIMPSSSNPADAEEAHKVATAFGIAVTTVDLTTLADTFYATVPEAETIAAKLLGGVDPASLAGSVQLAEANVRPRLRMITLYYLANLSHGIVVGTGNKTEFLIGYFTKYGDGGVDLAPIVDLYKHEVRSVARAIGVPESVISRPPSAGLWEGQTDEDEIGISYEVLDATLASIEGGDTSGLNPETLARVEHMVRTTEHKRVGVPRFTR